MLMRYLVLVIALFHSTLVLSQSLEITTQNDRIEQLNVVQSVLDAKLLERKALLDSLATAVPAELADLENEIKSVNAEIAEIRGSFEQIAVGSADLAVFGNESGEFDWRTEMTEVMMPIIRNLQSLTEKPRKVEALRSQILTNEKQLETANEALLAIEENIALSKNDATKQTLSNLQTAWKEQANDIARRTDVAEVKLANLLQNDESLLQSIQSGFVGFVKGRGLTLLLAIAVGLAVWYVMKFLSKLLTTKTRGEAAKTYRTRQRLVHYAFNVLTAILIAIAVIVVFYVRGDVLLLGLSFLIAGATLLGLRHTIPKFMSEAKLLLNLGSIREDERVVYDGLPYRVVSLNMYSVLKNPELTGVVRLPLDSMMTMISRPAGNEIWFPASKGDYILLSDGKLLEVLELTTELVQLQNLAGTKTSIPAADFYNMTFDNISRGENFAITSTFGVGYSHQAISNDSIPTQLQEAVSAALASASFAEHVISVAVELKEAGASSLDYWVCVTMSSSAVRSYFKINRIVQQTCVDTCTKENWDIPFPQLTVHNQ